LLVYVGVLTRRSFLAAGAGALASRLAWPAGGLAATIRAARPRLSELWLGDVGTGGRALALPAGTDLVGIEWHGPSDASPLLRVRARQGGWSRWVSAAGCGAGGRSAHAGPLVGAPVWVAGAAALELSAARALSGVRLHLVDAGAGAAARRLSLAGRSLGRAELAGAPQVLPQLSAGQPAILARSSWAQGVCHPAVAPGYGAVEMAFVHHTETPNGYLPGEVGAMLRSIFAYHRFVRGWNDIGYNFVIDAFGRIFEARAGGIDEPVVGAQAGGYNLSSTGVAVLGSFAGAPAPGSAVRALQQLLAWKLALHGVPALGRVRVRVSPAGAVYSRFPAGARVWLARIAGHRDGDSTDCPGDALYGQLPAIRGAAAHLARTPARATIALLRGAPNASASSPAPPAAPPALGGSLALLDGTPIVGALLSLQLRSVARRGEVVRERTLAQVRTGPGGAWTLALGPPGAAGHKEVWLRAFYDGRSGEPASGRGTVSQSLALPAGLIGSLQAPSPSAAA
jgi:hypothetical protein